MDTDRSQKVRLRKSVVCGDFYRRPNRKLRNIVMCYMKKYWP